MGRGLATAALVTHAERGGHGYAAPVQSGASVTSLRRLGRFVPRGVKRLVRPVAQRVGLAAVPLWWQADRGRRIGRLGGAGRGAGR
ncbi:MAG TPA: hypothetical protein DCQ52_09315, partial [Acidimicrobiaceae bacterium]|nr:hypothetical protein [Acidimicrobiaceae bacterium]